jgi:hypothetical protein
LRSSRARDRRRQRFVPEPFAGIRPSPRDISRCSLRSDRPMHPRIKFGARCALTFVAWSGYNGPGPIDRTKASKDRTRGGPAFFATFAIFGCDQRVIARAPSFQNHPPSTPKPSLLATAPIRCLARLIWSLEKPAAVPAFMTSAAGLTSNDWHGRHRHTRSNPGLDVCGCPTPLLWHD